MLETDLRRKLAWLIGIRAVISTLLLGGATFAQISAPGSFPVDPLFFLIAATYALTLAYASTQRFVDRHRWLADLQLGADAIIVSAFIYFTGGITSFFSSLYVLPIVAASTVQFRRGALLVAALSALIYVGLVLAQYLAASGLLYNPWLATNSMTLPPLTAAQYIVALNLFGFFAVALLSGSLAERVRSADAAAGARVDRDPRILAGAQSARDRQPAERPPHDRHGAADSHVQPRRRGRSPARPVSTRSRGRPARARCCSFLSPRR